MSTPSSPFTFDNVKRVSTTERIVENLVALIAQRSLQPGDKLPPERELCEIIGVSRPVLREALKALQVMNIIRIQQGAGAYVRSLEPQNIVEHLDIVFHLDISLYHDLYEARRVLEGSLARMAAARITQEELAALAENIRKAEEHTCDLEDFYQLDLDLHGIVLKAAGNRVMPVFMQSINKLVLLMRKRSNAKPHIRLNTIADHRMIYEALAARDGEAAGKAMEQHIANVEKAFLADAEDA
jgi:GntR family transcriptional repressor for pyruvate dehydrogenase complex